MKNIFLLVLILALLPCGGKSQTPQMVQNIGQAPLSSNPKNAVEFNGKLYFSARTSDKGWELYELDDSQTPGNQISLVGDIFPGTQSSNPRYLTVFNGKLYFSAIESVSTGTELFVYDGVNPPSMVADIRTGTNPGINHSFPGSLEVFNNKLYFSASSSSNDFELWAYDGTNAPQRVVDINLGGSAYPNEMTVFNNALYFSATDGSNNGLIALWKYDGVNTPTEIPNTAGNSTTQTDNVSNLYVSGGKLYYSYDGGNATGVELWAYDGTSAAMVADIEPGSGSSYPKAFQSYNGKLYFSATTASNGTELMAYDGTNAPGLIMDINPGTGDSNPGDLEVFNNKLFFSANDGTSGIELYDYDEVSVTLTANINPNTTPPATINSSPSGLTVLNNKLYFAANDGSPQYGVEMMVYDGVNAPQYVQDIHLGNDGSIPIGMIELNGAIYFAALHPSSGYELWKYDGTSATLFADLNSGTTSSSPTDLVVLNNQIYFAAWTPATGRELFVTDGVNPPTNVADIQAGAAGSNPRQLTVVNGKIYFTATTPAAGEELWVYDGTNAPGMVADLEVGPSGFRPENLIAFNNELYFTQRNVDKLWKYSGSTPPALLPNADYSNPFEFKVYNGRLYFSAESNMPLGSVYQLWSTNGNNAPTVAIADLEDVSSLGIYNNLLVFDATNMSNQQNLYFYDGTNPPTSVSKNGYVQGREYFESNGTLYWSGSSSSSFELWSYTTGGLPTMVHDINPGQGNALPSEFLTFNNELFFSATDGFNGRELWKLDPNSTALDLGSGLQDEKLILYPNPTVDQLNIDAGTVGILQVEIYDLTGKVLRKVSGDVTSLKLADLPVGVYVARVKTPMAVLNKRFVKHQGR